MDPTCVQNAMSILCSAAFRECREVSPGQWLPSLLCQAECDRRRSIWNECVATIQGDGVAKAAFHDAMIEMVCPRRNFVLFTR
jgi:hypothetical protein